MVGTAVKKVMGRVAFAEPLGMNGAANLFQTASPLNGNINSIAAPAIKGTKRAFIVP